MHKAILFAVMACAGGAAFAQSEAEIMRYTNESLPQVRAGTMKALDFYRELYRKIAMTPANTYKWKAENLRIVGERVDIYEALEAGRITPEKAERMIQLQSAGIDETEQARKQASDEARRRDAAAAAAQDRAMALQLLQNNLARPAPAPLTIAPILPTPRTTCRTIAVGGALQTVCQ